MTFDPTKPVRLRNGDEARIICTDRKSHSGYTIVVLTGERDNCVTRRSNGMLGLSQGPYDLVNVPVETVFYSNIYPNSTGAFFETLTDAKLNRSKTYCGTIRMTFIDDVLIKVEKL